MEKIEFSSTFLLPQSPGTYIARLSNAVGKDELLNEIEIHLNFPAYFGGNWDALEECLTDLSWIEEKKVVLIHEGMPALRDEDLSTYLEVLSNALEHWRARPERCMRVIFPKNAEIRILEILK